MPTLSVWTTLLVRDGNEITRHSLAGKVIQLRADATRFHLWAWESTQARDNEDDTILDLQLHGASLTSLTDDDVTYEGFVDESSSPYGRPDGSRIMRRVSVILAIEPIDVVEQDAAAAARG